MAEARSDGGEEDDVKADAIVCLQPLIELQVTPEVLQHELGDLVNHLVDHVRWHDEVEELIEPAKPRRRSKGARLLFVLSLIV